MFRFTGQKILFWFCKKYIKAISETEKLYSKPQVCLRPQVGFAREKSFAKEKCLRQTTFYP